MSQYVLINRIKVQNANAIAGFTWGFPAITHFLGFSHNLYRKLKLSSSEFNDIVLSGCAVIAHHHQVHTYKPSYDFEFTQSRNPPYLDSHKKDTTPPIIEEGKLNMTISLLIKCEGDIGNREDDFIQFLDNICKLQRLAGGTILDIQYIKVFDLTDKTLRTIKQKLLPGFILLDRSSYLENHYQKLQAKDNTAELFTAWLDFIALKQKARPESNQISKYLQKLDKADEQYYEIWQTHLKSEYQQSLIPEKLKQYFSTIEPTKNNEQLLKEWQEYCNPDDKTNANWEYLPKPELGYLVPIMTGYKSISKVHENSEVENTRDSETDVCFVESVHSIGEWRSVHRLNQEDLINSVWNYSYEDNWYLCTQNKLALDDGAVSDKIITENPDDGFN